MINQEGLQEIGSPREALLHCDEVLETNHTEACSSTKADEENPPYTFWCIDCDTGTYYSTKPDSDYPLPLCLSDRCLKDFIVATAKRVSQQLEYIIEHTVRGGGNGKRERRRRYRKRKRDCKREWAEIQQQQR